MKRIFYTIILAIMFVIILLNTKITTSKYVIKTECIPKVVISIDKTAPEVTITDINGNSIVNENNQAISEAKVSYMDEISGIDSALYKYNPEEENFEGLESINLDNNETFTKTGWYEIEITDNARNISIYNFYLGPAVCRIEEIYFGSITSAVETVESNCNEVIEIVMLTNTEEDVTISNNKNILLNIDNYKIIGTFTIEESSSLYTENGEISSITEKPVFTVQGNLNILNGEYTAENANTIGIEGGTCNIDGGQIKQTSSDYYYTILVASNGKLVMDGDATVTGNYIGIRTEKNSITTITNGTINTNICAAAVYSNSVLEISDDAQLNCNGVSATVTSMATLKISGGIINQSGSGYAIDIQGGTAEISNGAEIVSSGTSAVRVAYKADLTITGGNIKNIGEGSALFVNNKSSGVCIVKINGNTNITSQGEYTVYVAQGAQTLEITGGTISNTSSSGYAIYVKNGTITVEGAIINGKTYY